MDYSQLHQATQDAIRLSFDENEDEVLKIPNFSMMERFLVFGDKDPWLFYNRMMENVFPADTKKSKNDVMTEKPKTDGNRHYC